MVNLSSIKTFFVDGIESQVYWDILYAYVASFGNTMFLVIKFQHIKTLCLFNPLCQCRLCPT